jgi:hypothetical protein
MKPAFRASYRLTMSRKRRAVSHETSVLDALINDKLVTLPAHGISASAPLF